jgi:hypothetical protein
MLSGAGGEERDKGREEAGGKEDCGGGTMDCVIADMVCLSMMGKVQRRAGYKMSMNCFAYIIARLGGRSKRRSQGANQSPGQINRAVAGCSKKGRKS